MLQDSKGNRLYRRLEIRVIYPENVLPEEKLIQKAPAGKGINDEHIFESLQTIATQLEEKFPWWEFKAVEIASHGRIARWNVVFDGYHVATPNEIPNEQQSSEPGTGAVDATPTTDAVGDTETRIPAAPELGETEAA